MSQENIPPESRVKFVNVGLRRVLYVDESANDLDEEAFALQGRNCSPLWERGMPLHALRREISDDDGVQPAGELIAFQKPFRNHGPEEGAIRKFAKFLTKKINS